MKGQFLHTNLFYYFFYTKRDHAKSVETQIIIREI
jgi:hypothetical protein